MMANKYESVHSTVSEEEVAAAKSYSQEHGRALRIKFIEAYGEEKGPLILKLMLDQMRNNIALDTPVATVAIPNQGTTEEELRKALRQLEDACDRRASLLTSEAYLTALTEIPDMSDALIELDHARRRARAALARPQAQATTDVLAERRRQVEVEGWTPEHDDTHREGEMAFAAMCYAQWGGRLDENRKGGVPAGWPWKLSWWKPKSKRDCLVKSAALAIAEIERLDRAARPATPSTAEGGR